MKRHLLTITLALIALTMVCKSALADNVEATLRYAEANRSNTAQVVAKAETQLRLMQADLRIAREIESDALRQEDREALVLAREAIAETKRGIDETRQLLTRAKSLLAQRVRTLQQLRAARSTGSAGDGVVVADGGDVRRYNADGVELGEATGRLQAGETVRTGSDGSARLFLGEMGSQVQLAPDSEFTVGEGDGLRDFIGQLKQGLARLMVRLDGKSRFEVRTPAAVCAVRGTDFAVENKDGQTRVRVFSGVVEVTASAHGKTIELNAGQQWDSGAQQVESFNVNDFPAPWESEHDAH